MARLQDTTLWEHRKCLLICAAVSLASLQYGVVTVCLGGFQAMPGFLMVFGYEDPTSSMGYGIDSSVQQVLASMMHLGTCISSILAGTFGAYFGRKKALWLACIICLAANALQIGSTSQAGLYIGRFLVGIANGFLVVFSTVYCSETAPAHLREIMVGLWAVYVTLGTILGAVINNYTSPYLSKLSYQIPLACMLIIPTMLIVALFFVPESPRWLLHRNQHEVARKSLEKLRLDHGDQLELEWAEMIRGVAEERRLSHSSEFMDMFRGNELRRTLLCYGTMVSESASGVWFFVGYQTYFFALAGITKAFEYTIMIACFAFAGVPLGLFMMNKLCGRRTIMIAGAFSCGLCELACGIASSVDPGSKATGNVLVAFTALFAFCYNGATGLATYPVITELVSSRLRAWTVGSAMALANLFAWLIGFCSPYFINPEHLNWGPRYTYIWAGSNSLYVIWFYLFLPETKARSLEELDELFEAGVGARKFKLYKCRIVEEAKHDVFGDPRVEVKKVG